MDNLQIYLEFRIFFFFTFVGKKTWARQVDYFFIREKMVVWPDTTRFNLDIPIFQY